ncbi:MULTISPECIES: M20/M25/M40 family metallo-hydrolase [Halobacterium]|uniref:M20/M25/M40 family metallo-hydrolase n=1 Tax=Halobacterium TaxID=2239 RepID=UPI00073F7675|nr:MULTISPECIES: M20/M25/M40 family metallo-hydrolase [Halobacterium]MCG1004566.1 M20/M25/M40 family metallo-hydrolase [Halobacterium noricense]
MPGVREFASELVSFASTDGDEASVSSWFCARLDELGFETYEWDVDVELLASHRSFPDDPREIRAADRRSVGGVLELGDPDAGPTLVLNGHLDVVPADEAVWSSQPFEARWRGDELTARGAADMKSGLAACVFAALALAERGLDGRVVVEGVVGEEAGGVGAATAALDNPYPFDRDAAIIAEPTALTPVVASEGSLMKRLRLTGRSSHAATPWRGESVLPHFDSVREAFADLAEEREQSVTHPLYEEFPTKWPVVCGTVEAGEWASTVPASLTAEWRIGVAPGETVAAVEAEFEERLADVVADSEWLSEHPPEFERFSVQFEASEISPDEPVVTAVQSGMRANDLGETAPRGVTYGADARHYIEAGIPTVMFGPGSIEQAHFPDETIDFREVETAVDVLADAAEAFLAQN